MQARRVEGQAILWTVKPCGIGDRGHFNRGLRAIGETVIHFWIEITCSDFFIAPPEKAPDRVGGRIAVMRAEIHALSCGDQFKAARLHPIDKFANGGGLIAIGHGIDHTFFTGARGQIGPA